MSRKSKAAEFVDQGWDVTVTGRNVLVTDAMKNYAIAKISKIDRFNHRVNQVNVTMDIQKLNHRVDILAKIDNLLFKSTSTTTQMYASIDEAVDKLTEQFRRYKSRITDHQAPSHEDVAMNVNVYGPHQEELLEVNDEIEAENNFKLVNSFKPHPIVKTESKPLRTLTHSEAILKMELSGEPFMIFRCEEDRKIKVIYRREDGNYGVVEPE